MKPFVNQIRNVTLKHVEKINEVDAEIKDLQNRRGDYSAEKYKELLDNLQIKRAETIKAGETEIGQIVDGYKGKVQDHFKLKGEDLTPDAQLLSSGIKLKAADLEALFDKYSGNATMQRLISEYNDQHEVKMSRAYHGEAEYLEAADTMAGYSRNLFSRPDYADIMSTDEYMEQTAPAVFKEA